MGIIKIAVTDEDGHDVLVGVLSPQPLDHLLRAHTPLPTSCCLRFLDPTGDTVFNGLQLDALREELVALGSNAKDPASRAVLEETLQLVRRCEEEPHLYLKFFGD